MDERSFRPDFTMPATRRAHSPNDGPFFAALRLAAARSLRVTGFGRGEIVGISIRFLQSHSASSESRWVFDCLQPSCASRALRERLLWRFFLMTLAHVAASPSSHVISRLRDSRFLQMGASRSLFSGGSVERLFGRLSVTCRMEAHGRTWPVVSARPAGSLGDARLSRECYGRRARARRTMAGGGRANGRCVESLRTFGRSVGADRGVTAMAGNARLRLQGGRLAPRSVSDLPRIVVSGCSYSSSARLRSINQSIKCGPGWRGQWSTGRQANNELHPLWPIRSRRRPRLLALGRSGRSSHPGHYYGQRWFCGRAFQNRVGRPAKRWRVRGGTPEVSLRSMKRSDLNHSPDSQAQTPGAYPDPQRKNKWPLSFTSF